MSRAYQLTALPRAGIDPARLGCIMLDVTLPDLADALPAHWGYLSPTRWWVNGVQTRGHATLLYGLLPQLVDPLGVDEVLDGWEAPAVLRGRDLEVFGSPLPGEPYACLVARVDCPELEDAHARLSLLPHLDPHPSYKPHVTLAYLQSGREQQAFDRVLSRCPLEFDTEGLNYGAVIGGRR